VAMHAQAERIIKLFSPPYFSFNAKRRGSAKAVPRPD